MTINASPLSDGAIMQCNLSKWKDSCKNLIHQGIHKLIFVVYLATLYTSILICTKKKEVVQLMKSVIFVVTIILLISEVFFAVGCHWNRGKQSARAEQVILFYSKKCSHCQVVEKFVVEHQLHQKLVFEQKEVSQNDKNRQLLFEKAKKCHLGDNAVGVPFLWDGVNCMEGSDQIIHYFNQKLHEK
jgi:hypothetical protein